jgi:hypothetical protein
VNVANVRDRFAVLAGLDADALQRWMPLIEDACAFVEERCLVQTPDSRQTTRLEALGAAYALRLFSLCGDNQIREFTAGDVKLTSSADRQQTAAQLWHELAADNADLVRTGGFLFGRVII